MAEAWLTIGELARRTGVAASALRFYEEKGLIASRRSTSGQRRFAREALRRVAFVRAARRVGLTLAEVQEAMALLPGSRTPTRSDWARLSRAWRARLDAEIAGLERVRDQLTSCIGCGCLSLRACSLSNPEDRAARLGPGARYLVADRPAEAGWAG